MNAKAQKFPGHRQRGADPGVFIVLPARLVDQIEAWAERTGRPRAAAFRELVVRGFEQFETITFPVQIVKYRGHRRRGEPQGSNDAEGGTLL